MNSYSTKDNSFAAKHLQGVDPLNVEKIKNLGPNNSQRVRVEHSVTKINAGVRGFLER